MKGRILFIFRLFKENPKQINDNKNNLTNLGTRETSKTQKT